MYMYIHVRIGLYSCHVSVRDCKDLELLLFCTRLFVPNCPIAKDTCSSSCVSTCGLFPLLPESVLAAGSSLGGSTLSQWPPQRGGSKYRAIGLEHWLPEG